MLAVMMAAAALAGSGPEAFNTPRWISRPTPEDVAAVYPVHAQRAEISGSAMVRCRGGAQGRLEDCEVFAEAPDNEGFGLAALRLAPKFRFGTALPLAPGVGPTISIPIRFNMYGRPGPTRLVIDAPRWVRAPTFDDLAKAFPATAKVADALVILRCQVAPNGAVGDCETRAERPERQGFGDAARSLVGGFRIDPEGLSSPNEGFAADIRFHFLDPKGADFQRRSVIQPTWLMMPDPKQARALFPAAAAAKGLKVGQGVVACAVAADGKLNDCTPLAGNPDGFGFSDAALKVTSLMRMSPWTADGGPVDGARLTLPIRFDNAADRP